MKEFITGWVRVDMIRIGPVVMKKKRSIFGKKDNGVQGV
jgi:hypothetical protein